MRILLSFVLLLSVIKVHAQVQDIVKIYQKIIVPKAELYLNQGRAQLAINLLDNQSAELAYHTFGNGDTLTIQVYEMLARGYDLMDVASDKDYYLFQARNIVQSIELREKLGRNGRELEKMFHQKSQKHARVHYLLKESLLLKDQLMLDEHPYLVKLDYQLSLGYMLIQQYGEAKKRLRYLVDSKLNLIPLEDPLQYLVKEKLAKCFYHLGIYYNAYHYNQIVINELYGKAEMEFSHMSFRQREEWVASIYPIISEMLWMSTANLKEDDGEASEEFYNLLLQLKGIQLKEVQHLYQVFEATKNAELKELLTHWRALRNQLAGYETSHHPEQVAKLQRVIDQHEIKMIHKVKQIPLTLPDINSFQQVRNALGANEAAVEIIRSEYQGDIRYIALISSHEYLYPQVVILNEGKAMESEYLEDYQLNMYKSFSSVDRLGKRQSRSKDDKNRLIINKGGEEQPSGIPYEKYWKPLTPYLEGIEKVYLSPDGIFNRINVETLFNEETLQYLFNEYQVILVESTREVPLRKYENWASIPTSSPVLIANPRYDFLKDNAAKKYAHLMNEQRKITSIRYISSKKNVPPLPYTQLEAMDIQATMGGKNKVVLLTDKMATEGQVKQLKGPEVLHIATHGYWNREADVLPMMQVGVLLAGVEDAERSTDHLFQGENGVLTAYEAANIDLLGTQLVVLSACETALGEMHDGEGVYGLQRGFRMAGVNSIMMSLWSVDDKITQELMKAFYHQKSKGLSIQAALRVAQKIIKAKYPQPKDWGAFVIQGL